MGGLPLKISPAYRFQKGFGNNAALSRPCENCRSPFDQAQDERVFLTPLRPFVVS